MSHYSIRQIILSVRLWVWTVFINLFHISLSICTVWMTKWWLSILLRLVFIWNSFSGGAKVKFISWINRNLILININLNGWIHEWRGDKGKSLKRWTFRICKCKLWHTNELIRLTQLKLWFIGKWIHNTFFKQLCNC